MDQLRQLASGRPETVHSSMSDDSSLVAAILNKDRKATAEFVMRFADSIYSYVRSRLAPRYTVWLVVRFKIGAAHRIAPALAKNARTGRPQFRNGAWPTQARFWLEWGVRSF